MNNKETIFLATLELASEKGLGNISLSQIAKKVGIQKPSLYSHFTSKEELISGLYLYLRESAQKSSDNSPIDYGKLVEVIIVKEDCPCKKKNCKRHGDCDACRAYHAKSK